MARGYFRVNDETCLYCGHREQEKRMPWKIGKGANKTYLCDECFKKSIHSKEADIEKYRNK